jgi:prepilin-type N-terminal cleavage/methylation domain-containing protein
MTDYSTKIIVRSKKCRSRSGFSLAEILVVLTIGAMVLVTVLSIYNRMETSAAAITRKLDSSQLPSEVLQRIAEDLDSIGAPGADTKITIENKLENGFSTARLTILKTINNDKNEKQTLEKIIWQTSYDNAANRLVLYRSHSGIVMEDKLLDQNKDDWERELFVPVCSGVTFFKIQVPVGEEFRDSWTADALPLGIVVTVSFAEPFKALDGTLDVLEDEKITRHITVGRTREIKFTLAKKENEQNKSDENQVLE